MKYISTRGNYNPVSSAEAIKLGMVPRSGLFVPDRAPKLELLDLTQCDYKELAVQILTPFLSDYTPEEIQASVDAAYNLSNFDSSAVAPLTTLDEKTAVLELWHGPTAAFKDYALQIMPRLFTQATAKLRSDKETVILVATSGDTGKAALEGYRDVPGTKVIVFYPKHGVSPIQELQMLTTEGKNTYAVGVEGNFDDCQTMVKEIFGTAEIVKKVSDAGFEFSSANSINWGRLVPQIIYYFWAYIQMLKKKLIMAGDSVDFVVPTGNFGNILAAHYAQEMGLPVNCLICASNMNNVLTEFIDDGFYNRKRKFFRTASPSMDILISSNLERFLFEMTLHNAEKINRWYDELGRKGSFKVDDSTKQRIQNRLYGETCSEEETAQEIRKAFEDYHYLIDPHTAVAFNALAKYRKDTGENVPTVIDSTASAFKFNRTVYTALTGKETDLDEFVLLDKLQELTGVPIHRALAGLDKKPIGYRKTIRIEEAKDTIFEILGVK